MPSQMTPTTAHRWGVIEEQVRGTRREIDELRGEMQAMETRLRDSLGELRDDLRVQAAASERCMGMVSQAIDGVSGALRLLARPTPGTLALAGMLTVVTLAWIGWSVVDVLQAADWMAGRVAGGEP